MGVVKEINLMLLIPQSTSICELSPACTPKQALLQSRLLLQHLMAILFLILTQLKLLERIDQL